jgi:hypothetical protein
MQISRDIMLDALQLAKDREEPVVLSPEGKGVSFLTTVLEMSREWVTLKNPVPPELASFVVDSPQYLLFFRSFKMAAPRLFPHGVNLQFPISHDVEQTQSRNEERIYFSEKERAWIEIQHPFDSATQLFRRVFDLSQGGLSFRARVHTPFIQSGRLLPSCEVFVDGESRVKKSGKIVYVKQIIDLRGQSYFQVGVQFTDAEGGEENL